MVRRTHPAKPASAIMTPDHRIPHADIQAEHIRTLQNMQQGISMVDQDGRLRMWNQHFLDLLGLGHRQLDDQQRSIMRHLIGL